MLQLPIACQKSLIEERYKLSLCFKLDTAQDIDKIMISIKGKGKGDTISSRGCW